MSLVLITGPKYLNLYLSILASACSDVLLFMHWRRDGLQWAHLSCAVWIPEVTIGCSDRMQPIQNIDSIPVRFCNQNPYFLWKFKRFWRSFVIEVHLKAEDNSKWKWKYYLWLKYKFIIYSFKIPWYIFQVELAISKEEISCNFNRRNVRPSYARFVENERGLVFSAVWKNARLHSMSPVHSSTTWKWRWILKMMMTVMCSWRYKWFLYMWTISLKWL